MSAERMLEAIKRGRRFLISSHMNLEGDSLGSELAAAYLLKKLRKSCFICNATPIPRIYNFLPSLDLVKTSPEKIRDFDTALILDCSDIERIGRVKDLIAKDKVILNIDHHPDNNNFGAVNWVNPKASAVGEILYELFQKSGVKLNKDTALCLYIAILTDTGGFRYENTTTKTHMIAGRLLEYGIKPNAIFSRIYEAYQLARMKLLSRALAGLKLNNKSKIAWMSVSENMLRETGATTEDSDGFIELVRSIEGVEVAIFFQEIEKNKVKVGFRSKGKIDVSEIAHSWGGGGHFAASGCTLKGKLGEVEKKVLKKVSEDISYGAKRT